MFWVYVGLAALGVAALVAVFLSVRYIPNHKVGVIEKLWSNKGSLGEGRIIALNGEAGYQSNMLRGGLHFGLWRWQYAVHKLPLISSSESKCERARGSNPSPFLFLPT